MADHPKTTIAYSAWAMQQVRERRSLINKVDEWILGEIKPYLGQRILEVGCGLGSLMRYLVAERELVVGVDIDHESVESLRDTYAQAHNVRLQQLDICDPRALNLRQQDIDTVLSSNVFEHIENDLLALVNTRGILRSGGRVVLIVPAHMALYGTIDSAIGHYRRYDKAMMSAKLEQAGFRVVALKYLNMLGVFGWYVNGRLLRQSVPPSGQLKLFNQLVPLLRGVEQIVPAPFGLSLVAVGQAP